MKKIYLSVFVFLLSLPQVSQAVTHTWNTYVAGSLSYTNGNMSTVITGTAFDTRGPQDPNGGASNGYKSPKYVSAATINTYQGGFTNDYGMPGLVVGHDWTNLSSSTVITITFTSPIGGPVSFNIYDINTGSWGGNNPVWIDKITVVGTDCAGNAVYPVISGCSNAVSGANSNIITGNLNCTNQTNTVTFNASSIKTITITYASGSPLSAGYGTDPDPQYIIVSDITSGAWSLLTLNNNSPAITCTSSTATLSASSSAANASYSWAGPNSGNPAGTTPNAASTTVNAAGTYTVTVTDISSGCSASASVVVTQSSNPPGASIATPATITCSTPTITLTASSGTGGVTYAWSGGGNSANKSVSSSGTYTVTVTNPANNCSSTAAVTVSANTTPPDASVQPPASLSCVVNSVTITAGSSTPSATFAWSGGGTGATKTVSTSGTYTVTVTDPANGCTASVSATVTSTGTPIQTTIASTDATCGNNNGTATVTITAGTATGYNWSSGASSATATNLSAGNYTVTVTGNGGCSATASVSVTASGSLSITATPTNATCGNNNGSATVSVTSGTATAYNWSSGDNTATAVNLAAGNYTVTVTGGGTCSATASVTVTTTAALTITATSVNTTCGNSNGSASVTVTAGNGITYNWSNGATNDTIYNLAAGTYHVTVHDGNGCSATATVVVNPSGNSPVTITADKNIFCAGDSAQICAPANYTSYLWNTGETTPCISAKLAGNYYVTVTDNGNCTALSNPLAVNVYQQPPVSISVTGDTLHAFNALTYQWFFNNSPINGANSGIYIAEETGLYQVLVTDSNGCSALSNPIPVNLTGIQHIFSEEEIYVYPNPLKEGHWTLQVASALVGASAEIFDNNGRLIYKDIIQQQQSILAILAAKGVYWLKIVTPQNTVTKKLIRM